MRERGRVGDGEGDKCALLLFSEVPEFQSSRFPVSIDTEARCMSQDWVYGTYV